jgi:hypothetical protein
MLVVAVPVLVVAVAVVVVAELEAAPLVDVLGELVVTLLVRVRDFVVVVVVLVLGAAGFTRGTPSLTVGRDWGVSSMVRLFSTQRPAATAVTAARQTASTPMTILVACLATNRRVGVRSAATAASSS